jgi:hypothetical protein
MRNSTSFARFAWQEKTRLPVQTLREPVAERESLRKNYITDQSPAFKRNEGDVPENAGAAAAPGNGGI